MMRRSYFQASLLSFALSVLLLAAIFSWTVAGVTVLVSFTSQAISLLFFPSLSNPEFDDE